MTDAHLRTDRRTAFAKAWDVFREANKQFLDPSTLTPGPYLENRLFMAFSDGWNASTTECLSILKVKV